MQDIKVVTSVLILGATLTSLLLFNPNIRKLCCSGEYQTFTSPNSEYAIKVYRISVFPSVTPGSSGDAPGYVRLYNNNNEVLQEKDVEMVQLVNHVDWRENSVRIKFVAEWELPD